MIYVYKYMYMCVWIYMRKYIRHTFFTMAKLKNRLFQLFLSNNYSSKIKSINSRPSNVHITYIYVYVWIDDRTDDRTDHETLSLRKILIQTFEVILYISTNYQSHSCMQSNQKICPKENKPIDFFLIIPIAI